MHNGAQGEKEHDELETLTFPHDQKMNVNEEGDPGDLGRGSCEQWLQLLGSHSLYRTVIKSLIRILKEKEMLNVDAASQSLANHFLLSYT